MLTDVWLELLVGIWIKPFFFLQGEKYEKKPQARFSYLEITNSSLLHVYIIYVGLVCDAYNLKSTWPAHINH